MAIVSTIETFDGADGASPTGGLIADAAGDLFGATSEGGADNYGVVYELPKTSAGYGLTVIASFDYSDGAYPVGPLVADAAGDLFGMTSGGGASGDGVVFEIAKTGTGYASTPTILANLDDNTGFDSPSANGDGGLTIDAAGDLFGATSDGATDNGGAAFEIAKTAAGYAGTPTVLVDFGIPGASSSAVSGLTLDANGDLFGDLAQTPAGQDETSNYTIFEIAKIKAGYASTATSLYNYTGAPASSISGVTIDAAGDLYFGEALGSVFNSSGAVAELAKSGAGYSSEPTTLVKFSNDDNLIRGSLTLDSAGDLFGLIGGGAFEIVKTAAGYATTPAIGGVGSLYGTALVDAEGDVFAVAGGGPNYQGTVAEVVGLSASLEITSPGGRTNQTAQTLTGTINAADADDLISLYEGTTLLGSVTPAADGDWIIAVELLSTQGAQSITAQATNPVSDAGSLGETPAGTSAPVVYTLDTAPLALTIVVTSELPDATTQTLTGTIDATDSGQTILIYDGSTLVGTTTANSADSWTATVALATSGPDVLTARVMDVAGALDVSNAADLASGGRQALDFTSSADAASLFDSGGDFDSVYGAGGTVYLTSAQVEMFAPGATIDFAAGSGNAVAIYSTGYDPVTVNGDDGLIVLTQAGATVSGGGDAIYFEVSGDAVQISNSGANWDAVYGSDGDVELSAAFAEVTGGGETIGFSGPSWSAAALYNTGALDFGDKISGSPGEVVLTAAYAQITGGGYAIYFEGSGANGAALYNTEGVFDGVTGSNGEIVMTNAQAEVVGGNSTIYLLGSATNTLAIYNTGAAADAINSSNSLLVLTNAQATVSGSSNTIYLVGASTVTQNGASDAFVFQPAIGEDTINGFAATDTMQFSASDFANFAALQSHMSQSGANTVITLDASDTVTLTNVAATSLTASQFHFV